jgi:hypothetical protein
MASMVNWKLLGDKGERMILFLVGVRGGAVIDCCVDSLLNYL